MSPSKDADTRSSEDSFAELWERLTEKVDALLEREPIKDEQYRGMIFAAQIGDLFKALTHDPAINPKARPVGDELSYAGDALIQLLIYLRARGLSLASVYQRGLDRMNEQVWRAEPKGREEAKQATLAELPPDVLATGETAVAGKATAKIVVVRNGWSASKVTEALRRYGGSKGAIVAMEDYPEDAWSAVRNNLNRMRALLLVRAGKTSHPANVCRDHGKPCAVGIQGFERLTTGEVVEFVAQEGGQAVVRRPKENASAKFA